MYKILKPILMTFLTTTAVLKYNYEIDKIEKLFIKDFTDEEINEYEKTLQ